MKKVKALISAILLSAMTISLSGCNMITKTEASKNKAVVATVYGEKITYGELMERMKPVTAYYKSAQGLDLTTADNASQLLQAKQSVLDVIIQEKIISKNAEDLKIATDTKALESEVSAQITVYKTNYNTEYAFEEALKTNGYTLDMLKNEVRISILTDKIKSYLVKNVTITDSEVQSYYDKNKDIKFTTKPSTFNVANALFTTEDEAKKALAKIKAGTTTFAKVADEVNTDSTKGKGGDLGEYYYDDDLNQSAGKQLVSEFFNAAIKLKEGEVSAPVQSTYGWHLIKVTNIKKYPVEALSKVKDTIKETLLDNKKSSLFSTKYSEWKTAAKVVTDKYTKNLTQ